MNLWWLCHLLYLKEKKKKYLILNFRKIRKRIGPQNYATTKSLPWHQHNISDDRDTSYITFIFSSRHYQSLGQNNLATSFLKLILFQDDYFQHFMILSKHKKKMKTESILALNKPTHEDNIITYLLGDWEDNTSILTSKCQSLPSFFFFRHQINLGLNQNHSYLQNKFIVRNKIKKQRELGIKKKDFKKWGITTKTAITKRYRQAMLPFLPDLMVGRKITRKRRDVTPLRPRPLQLRKKKMVSRFWSSPLLSLRFITPSILR